MALMTPKNYNRIYLMNLGTPAEPDWKPITVGISATEVEVEEEAEDYYYMDGRGTPESEPATQKITRTFTGHRKVGDPVQDYVFDVMMEDLNKRNTEIIEYNDMIAAGTPNGKKYPATVSVQNDGSGEAQLRQDISFSITKTGASEKGTVTNSDGDYTWAKAQGAMSILSQPTKAKKVEV